MGYILQSMHLSHVCGMYRPSECILIICHLKQVVTACMYHIYLCISFVATDSYYAELDHADDGPTTLCAA